MKIDDVVERAREHGAIEDFELQALLDYVAFLEFGYAGLQRTDMVDQAKKSAGKRIDDHRKGNTACDCGPGEECHNCPKPCSACGGRGRVSDNNDFVECPECRPTPAEVSALRRKIAQQQSVINQTPTMNLIEQRDTLLERLRAVEWKGYKTDDGERCCPNCEAWAFQPGREEPLHAYACSLAIAIGVKCETSVRDELKEIAEDEDDWADEHELAAAEPHTAGADLAARLKKMQDES